MAPNTTEPQSADVDNQTHEEALSSLMRALLGHGQDRQALAQALDHISHCRICQEDILKLRGAIMGEGEKHLTGPAADAMTADALANILEDLRDPELEDIDTTIGLEFYPDLGQMRRLQEAVGRSLAEVRSNLRRTPSNLAWSFADLQEGIKAVLISMGEVLGQSRNVAFAARSKAAGREDKEKIIGPVNIVDEPDLQLQLTIMADNASDQLCRAVVEVAMPDRFPDYPSVEVIVRQPAGEQRKRTDEKGRVEFLNITRNELGKTEILLVMPGVDGRLASQKVPKNRDG